MKGEKRKMSKSKTATTIALILMLTSIAISQNMPSTAAAVSEIDTFLFLMVSPNPVGVGQQVSVIYQLDKLSPTAVGFGVGEHFRGIMITITRPDGTTEKIGPLDTLSTSSHYFTYTPAKTGTYKFQAEFPGQWINTTTTAQSPYRPNSQYWFKPSTSGIAELTVQEQPIPPYPDTPLPTGYWARPIYGEFKGFWKIADNWLMRAYDRVSTGHYRGQAFAPYTSAPDSPHILWTRQLWFGGIGGGKFEDKVFYAGMSYEQPFEPLILSGRIIYTETGPSDIGDKFGTRCLDLYTGEEIWFLNNTAISFAQLVAIENPNEHGLIAYLWETVGTKWKMYDGFTGRYILTIENVTTGTTMTGSNGEILTYSVSGQSPDRRLVVWNSSKAISYAFPYARYAQVYEPGSEWNPRVGAVIDGRLGIELNVSIGTTPGSITIVDVDEGILIMTNMDTAKYPYVYTHAGFDINTGQQIWIQNRTDIYDYRVAYSANIDNGVYALIDRSELQIQAYDARTGKALWVSDPMPQGWAFHTRVLEVAYGKVLVQSWDGYFRAYDAQTGKLSWEYYFGNAGYETIYGTWPTNDGFTVADRKVFVFNDEHSPNSVLWRGAKLWALSVDTGELLWSISGWLDSPCISDGILIAFNVYDGQVYSFGKGPTATTVQIQNDVIALGNKVLVKGSVTDVSPGTKQRDQTLRFPSGVPAVSDECMSAWMEYVYMQQPKPTDVKGVEVIIEVFDPNGNYYEVARTTSDASGFFKATFEPPVPGEYTVIARFAGSESYWGSSAETAINVEEAPSPTPAPTPTPIPMSEMYFVPAIAGIIVAIIIGFALIALLLLKRRP